MSKQGGRSFQVNLALSFCLLLAACSKSESQKEIGEQVWSSNGWCTDDGLQITLHANGAYEEAGGNGRWFVRDGILHIQVIKQPDIAFESMYPELMALDQDGKLPFVGHDVVEAESGGFVKRFRRCK